MPYILHGGDHSKEINFEWCDDHAPPCFDHGTDVEFSALKRWWAQVNSKFGVLDLKNTSKFRFGRSDLSHVHVYLTQQTEWQA